MSLVQNAASFVAGTIVGAGGLMYYFRWRTRKQMARLEEHMGEMEDMADMFQPPEDDAQDQG